MKSRILTIAVVLLSVSGLVSAAERRVPSRTYPTIQSAVTAANPGDVVILSPNPTGTYGVYPNQITYNGVYTGGGNFNINTEGRAITIRSDTNPANPDPAVVAATIIDCAGGRNIPTSRRAFRFITGEGPDTMLIGLTIRNAWATDVRGGNHQGPHYRVPQSGDPLNSPIRANDGDFATGNSFGGGIRCDGASPTIKYCVIENCTVTGAQGGDGLDGMDGTWFHPADPCVPPYMWDDGQFGGWGATGSGNGYGGAIACINGSSPLIINCTIRNNTARGGVGGNGGDGGMAANNGTNGLESQGGNGGNGLGSGMGGGLYADGSSNPTVLNCTFSNNIATQGIAGSGGLRGEGEDDNQANPPISNGADGSVSQYSDIAGGAAFLHNSVDANFTNCTFNVNGAYAERDLGYGVIYYFYGQGGAIYTSTNNIVTLNKCVFTSNLPGAFYGETSLNLNITDCTFTHNSYSDYGGALWLESGSNVQLTRCNFSNNSSANDGGAIESASSLTMTDCTFTSNTATGWGGAIDLYKPGEPLNITATRCNFATNKSKRGGAFSSADFTTLFNDCLFSGNIAESGGAIDAEYGNLNITGGKFSANKTTHGNGAAISCLVTNLGVSDCTFEKNSAEGVASRGGAISLEGSAGHSITNCLFTENYAKGDGGAIYTWNWVQPTIANSTFHKNLTDSYGGAIFAGLNTNIALTDCIFSYCQGHAVHEYHGDGQATASYCLFYFNTDGDWYDSSTDTVYNGIADIGNIPDGSANIYGNPLFITGTLGKFYLSQVAAGQSSTSPAVNAGSNFADSLTVPLNNYTTRTDNQHDTGIVDIGYHYTDSSAAPRYNLTLIVSGTGGTITADPPTGPYYAGTTVDLTAHPNPGWTVSSWSGADGGTGPANTNIVVMSSNRTVTVSFKRPRTLYVPTGGSDPQDNYGTIHDAIYSANDGDTIIVMSGTYYVESVNVNKGVEIRSLHPDDSAYVNQTIIDGSRGTFSVSAQGVVINGFTFANRRYTTGPTNRDGNRQQGHPDGYDGGCSNGGVSVSGNSEVTFKNCIFRDNGCIGGNGGDGEDAQQTPPENAGRGGWGGWARGGAMNCGPYSEVKLINCEFRNNFARGGNGGNGGNGSGALWPNYGGLWSAVANYGQYPLIDSHSPTIITTIPGQLWDWFTADAGSAGLGQYPDAEIDPVLGTGGFVGNFRWYSGYGGGVFCGIGSTIEFTDCTITGNRTYGGMSGQGGGALRPLVSYEVPSYGGGVYCAAESLVTFNNCVLNDNIASQGREQNRDVPYMGYGGGVCAEDRARVIFNNCRIDENTADVGGGIYLADVEARITDCEIALNDAFHGGGIFGESLGEWGWLGMLGTTLANNIATGITDVNISDPNFQLLNVLGEGGALHLWDLNSEIMDGIVRSNEAEASGGGIYIGGENDFILQNCLFTNNIAGRDGGGISSNVFSATTIENCTIADNVVTGSGFAAGYGGGVYASYENVTDINNTIIWGNTAGNGRQLAIATGFEYDIAPSIVTVKNSNIQGGKAYVAAPGTGGNIWLNPACTLNWDEFNGGNIPGGANPFFTCNPINDCYYLGAGSPCINTGKGTAASLPLGPYAYTTQVNNNDDTDPIDMGYHYRKSGNFVPGDLNYDSVVDNLDALLWLSMGWLVECDWPDYCHGADLNSSGTVNLEDWAVLTTLYGEGDTEPPAPNPSTWEILPGSQSPSTITMKASTAIDNSAGDVWYFFQCLAENGTLLPTFDSGWVENPLYTATGLTPGKKYGFRVAAVDHSLIEQSSPSNWNITEWSAIAYARAGEDTMAPVTNAGAANPYQSTWATPPTTTSTTSITMTVTTATDTSGVEYRFENTSGGGHSSNWQASTTYTDTLLEPNTIYGYRVVARDMANPPNVGIYSIVAYATTFSDSGGEPNEPNVPTNDTTPPLTGDPNNIYKAAFATLAGQTRPGPIEVSVLVGSNYVLYHRMQAVAATDASEPVQYRFVCQSNSSFSSGWQTSPNYEVAVGYFSHWSYIWYIQIRDSAQPTPNNGYRSDYWNCAGQTTPAPLIP